jgi:hypothetical protein
MALVTIPSTFGTGGSGLNPTSDPTVNLANILTQLTAAVTTLQGQVGSSQSTQANPEELTSGALSVAKNTSRLSVTGTVAFTLPDGTTPGQIKHIYCELSASTPVGTLTPAHASGFTTIVFGAGSAGSSVDVQWDSSVPGWKVIEAVKIGTVTIS